jgi:hypothetical protein
VEGLWSPSLGRLVRIAAQNGSKYCRAQFRANAEGLSLSGGASIRHLSFFKLSITSVVVLVPPPETTKATRWVALAVSRYAARFLAHEPLSEDVCITAKAFRHACRPHGTRDDRGMGRRGEGI